MTTMPRGKPHRVGLIVPSSNVTMETEVPALLSRHPAMAARAVTFHSSRATLHRVDPESLRRMVTESDRCARELADARLDVVAYACLIAIMASGPGAHEAEEERQVDAQRPRFLIQDPSQRKTCDKLRDDQKSERRKRVGRQQGDCEAGTRPRQHCRPAIERHEPFGQHGIVGLGHQ